MQPLIHYLRTLPSGKQVLWCYLIWYLTMLYFHFEASPRLWLTSAGIRVVVGIGLILSVSGSGRPDAWTTVRLFAMPFCVSSFSALVKDRGCVLICSPAWRENAGASTGVVFFLAICWFARTRGSPPRAVVPSD